MDETEGIVVRPSSTKLWIGVLAGPIAWLADLQLCYALQRYACWNHAQWLLWAITFATLAVTVYGAVEAERGWREHQTRRTRFMHLAGLFISASFFLGILSTAVFLIPFGPCD